MEPSTGLFLLPFLFLASWLDLRQRIVHNVVWLHATVTALPLLPAVDMGGLGLGFTLGVAFWLTGFGGADGKLLMVAGFYLGPVPILLATLLGLIGSGVHLSRAKRSPFVLYWSLGYGLLLIGQWALTWTTSAT